MNRSRILQAILFFVIFCLPDCSSKYNIDDTILYAIRYNPASKNDQEPKEENNKIVDEHDESLLNNPPSLLQTVTMTTKHNEKYVCELPSEEIKTSKAEEEYQGPNVLKLLEKLFVSSKCAYRLEHYWTYELCHGKSLRQYHEERDGKNIKVTEYFLGHYNKETHDVKLKEEIEHEKSGRKPLRKKIESINMPFYELVMKDGTLCDLNGLPRTTRVQYVCYPNGNHDIYSLKESSTCEYEVVVLSSLLCSHPDYRPEESNEKLINCKPANDKTDTKPLDLLALETESKNMKNDKMFQAELFQGDKGPGSVRIEIKPVVPPEPSEEIELENKDSVNKDSNWPTQTPRQPVKPMVDPQVVQEFLLGQFCLYGGSGWWKYEFCYGKKVDQYHEEKGGQKTIINLGKFNLLKHKDHLENNPAKRPKLPMEARKHVSHFYTNGDLCDITGQPRHVEVKLKCKKSDSPSAVSIYLLEPKTCEYILGVESPLVCDILHTADENGIMKVTSKADFETAKTFSSDKKINEEKVVSEKEYIKFTLDDAITDPSKVKEKEPVVDDDEIYDSIITKAKENEEDEDPEDYDYIDDEDE